MVVASNFCMKMMTWCMVQSTLHKNPWGQRIYEIAFHCPRVYYSVQFKRVMLLKSKTYFKTEKMLTKFLLFGTSQTDGLQVFCSFPFLVQRLSIYLLKNNFVKILWINVLLELNEVFSKCNFIDILTPSTTSSLNNMGFCRNCKKQWNS